MMDLIRAFKTEDGRTENGALTHTTSSNAATDLFFQIGAFRNRDEGGILSAFRSAFADSPLDTMRILFYSRDVRGGQGERRTFRIVIRDLAHNQPEILAKNLHLIPEYGRWDDVLCLLNTPVGEQVVQLIRAALESGDALCAKWMPREKSANRSQARFLMRALGMSPKVYRKTLSRLTQVVETPMCQNEWGSITFEHVPSYAMKNYRKAFARHDEERWQGYMESLVKGETKVNASTLFPHDLTRQAQRSAQDDALIEQQWKALPNYMEGSVERILPMSDVSGSMTMYGGLPMDVSLALGMYISERNEGIFKNAVLTFTDVPQLFVLKGKSIRQRMQQLKSHVGYNTNIDKAFETLLDRAVKHSVSADKMPTMLLILSDMEFDNSCVRGHSLTAMNAIRQRYQNAGYDLPKIVFWNLAARHSNLPVKYDEMGTALVSGFSPSILKQLLAGKEFSPVAVMRQTINSARYQAVTV